MKHTSVVTLVLVLAACGVRADDPPKPDTKPMWQRLLQGKDAKKAAELEKKIAEYEKADRYPDAITTARAAPGERPRRRSPRPRVLRSRAITARLSRSGGSG